MARLFNVEVFNQTIGASKPYYTGEQFYALLGSADSLFAQIILDSATDADTTATVTFETTNASQEQTWGSGESQTAVIDSLGDLPAQEGLVVPGEEGALGAFIRFKVSSDKNAATVRIIVCGRSN